MEVIFFTVYLPDTMGRGGLCNLLVMCLWCLQCGRKYRGVQRNGMQHTAPVQHAQSPTKFVSSPATASIISCSPARCDYVLYARRHTRACRAIWRPRDIDGSIRPEARRNSCQHAGNQPETQRRHLPSLARISTRTRCRVECCLVRFCKRCKQVVTGGCIANPHSAGGSHARRMMRWSGGRCARDDDA